MYDPYIFAPLKFENGLSVFVNSIDRPWLEVNIIVHSGSKDDSESKDGLAHFVEHVLCQNNSEGWPPELVYKQFQKFGGTVNLGLTNYERTVYGFFVPLESNNLEFALKFLGRMILACSVKHKVEHERQVIIREFTRKYPFRWEADRISKRFRLLFAGCRLGRFVGTLGVPESIDRITAEDLQSFYDCHYNPANISIVAIGGLGLDEFADAIQKSPFGMIKSGNRSPLPSVIKEVIPPSETKIIYKLSDYFLSPSDQSTIDCFAALPGTINRKVVSRAGDVLRDVICEEIREQRGWTYGFSVNSQRFPEAYEVSIGGAFPWEASEAIEDLINECLIKAAKNTDLINHHIRSRVLSYKIFDASASRVSHDAVYDLGLYNRIYTLKDEIEDSENVTVEQVQSLLKSLTKERRLTVLFQK